MICEIQENLVSIWTLSILRANKAWKQWMKLKQLFKERALDVLISQSHNSPSLSGLLLSYQNSALVKMTNFISREQ